MNRHAPHYTLSSRKRWHHIPTLVVWLGEEQAAVVRGVTWQHATRRALAWANENGDPR